MYDTRLQIGRCLAILAIGVLLNACTSIAKGFADLDMGVKERGLASWYGDAFHGEATASGELFDMEALTAAHRTLPLGTVIKVTNILNGRQIRLRINDRGPYVSGRILDLSYAAAQGLEMVGTGVAAIQLEVVGMDEERVVADPDGATTTWHGLRSPVAASKTAGTTARGPFRAQAVAIGKERPVIHFLRVPPLDVRRERRPRKDITSENPEHESIPRPL